MLHTKPESKCPKAALGLRKTGFGPKPETTKPRPKPVLSSPKPVLDTPPLHTKPEMHQTRSGFYPNQFQNPPVTHKTETGNAPNRKCTRPETKTGSGRPVRS